VVMHRDHEKKLHGGVIRINKFENASHEDDKRMKENYNAMQVVPIVPVSSQHNSQMLLSLSQYN